jgi:hypothetical protein
VRSRRWLAGSRMPSGRFFALLPRFSDGHEFHCSIGRAIFGRLVSFPETGCVPPVAMSFVVRRTQFCNCSDRRLRLTACQGPLPQGPLVKHKVDRLLAHWGLP